MKVFLADDLPEAEMLSPEDSQDVSFSTDELGDGQTYYVSFSYPPDEPRVWERIRPKIAARFRRRRELIQETK